MYNEKSDIDDFKLRIFAAQNPRVTIQKGLFLREYRHSAQFSSDRNGTQIAKYAEVINVGLKWTDNCQNLYFNDERIREFIKATHNEVSFSTVLTEKEVLSRDEDWKKDYRYRALFPSGTVCASEIERSEWSGELVAKTSWRFCNIENGHVTFEKALAFLTNDDDAAVLIKMTYPSVILESAEQ